LSGSSAAAGPRKRFWNDVRLVAEPDGFAVRLDAQPLRLAGGAVLRPTGRALAEAVAAEWSLAGEQVGGSFGPDDLMLTALAGTLQEHVAPAPGVTAERLARFADSDLLCYRASGPAALVALQAEAWQPCLDWLRAAHGIDLVVCHGLMPVAQPEPVLMEARRLVAGLPPEILTGLGVAVPGLGSLVLGLALAEGRLDAAEAFRLSRLDEAFQASHWGTDREAEAQAARLYVDIAVAARFMALAAG